MIELRGDELRFSFPEVHRRASCRIEFIRTLRIPDDGDRYALPPGLDSFPLQHVDDFAARVPEPWLGHGGVFLPMYQAEAMWLSFDGDGYPVAVKIAAGKINAITGEPWQDRLSASPKQDYVVVPEQPWLDGFYAGKGLIRQFVAMPLGEGYTAEEQLTGTAEHGGLQVVAYPMRKEEYEKRFNRAVYSMASVCCDMAASGIPDEMGLAPGGLMEQEIYEDEFGIDVWDQSVGARCFVHILNSAQYRGVTGRKPPTEPPTAQQYAAAGLPWFRYYDRDREVLDQAGKLEGLDSIAAARSKKGLAPLAGNEPLQPQVVKTLSPHGPSVRDGDW